ncbi:hypothetical protein OA57_07520 [Chelonobacter oris]|uniref:Uncharacterized protein n=2 Tax=Chelonobacter oris TaxID=505317 RepID=A0A0A3ALP2_9PAST|nr:hypothetical protein OA57_07520 [Chelonobacter oris]
MKKMAFLSLVFAFLVGCSARQQQDNAQSAAYARVQVALGYLQQHQYEAAKQSLDKALQHNPDYYLPYLVSAHYYQLIGNSTQAENQYLTALQKDPHQGDTHNNYGAFLCQQGKFAEAFRAFETALASRDYYRLAQTYENTALCAHQAGDNIRRTEALQKLDKIDSAQAKRLGALLR